MSDEQPRTYTCRILAIEEVTHDVRRFVVEKPADYAYQPGQAAEIHLKDEGWREETRPFTFTSLNRDANLEFTIKSYPDHDGVTVRLHALHVGDELILGEPWGAIAYRGPGLFIAGGAGVTPFIAILRQLAADDELHRNALLFSNRTGRDIILEGELTRMLGERANYTLTQDEAAHCLRGRIDGDMIRRCARDDAEHFYLCGPPDMVQDLSGVLSGMGVEADHLVVEE